VLCVVLSDLDEFLCLRAVEPDSTGEHAQTSSTLHACIAARDRGCGARFLPRSASNQAARSIRLRIARKSALIQIKPQVYRCRYALLVIVGLAVDGWICK
jgi:hypothetical protein